MNIYYCVRSLDGVPSCIYNIQLLKEAGYNVIPVLGSSSKPLNETMMSNGISIQAMDADCNKKERGSVFERLFKTVRYRYFAQKSIRKQMQPNDIIFLGTGDTIVSLLGLFKREKRVLVLKELYDIPKYYNFFLKKAAKDASAIVCCEENRSRIMKFRWNLPTLPYTLPNKPTAHPQMRFLSPSCEQTQANIDYIRGKKVILYQARHIHFVSELKNLALALHRLGNKYLLVLVGTVDNPQELQAVIDIYPNVYMTGHVPAPKHMEITSYAHIGVAVYEESSLNNLFCAPNKIFEYSGFGIPVLGNRVPGLVSTIGIAGAGECVEWSDIDEIEKAFQKIETAYDRYEANAKTFYQGVDCKQILKRIVEDVEGK